VPLTIEDGTNVAGATSYATRAEIIAYAAARGVVIADADASDVFAIKAMDYIERQSFKGVPTYGPVGVVQALQFPRDEIEYQGAYFEADAIPLLLKNAECEAAMLISQGIDLEPNRAAEQGVKREKVGPLETEFFAEAPYSATTPQLDALLKPLIVGSGFAINVIRK
jgi:hypothetical protein